MGGGGLGSLGGMGMGGMGLGGMGMGDMGMGMQNVNPNDMNSVLQVTASLCPAYFSHEVLTGFGAFTSIFMRVSEAIF